VNAPGAASRGRMMNRVNGRVAAPEQAEESLTEPSRRRRFAELTLPHLAAAYNLARWLTRDDHDAEDVVQEAYLRAYRYFDAFRGGEARAWLLGVVRNTGRTWLKRNRPPEPPAPFDEELHGATADDPAGPFLRGADRELLRRALEELPADFREAVVLREMEGLSYKEIAAVTGVPAGTVMSRLARGRERLRRLLAGWAEGEA
jgi:RNA polymerase sigma factor (sigma-70 family)